MFSQLVTPISAAVPDAALLLEQINNASDKCCMATVLANVGQGWFSGFIREQGAFTWSGQEHSFTVLLQASVNFPILSHGVIQRDLDNPQAITWTHHISATMLIEEGKDEVASILEAVFKKKM